MENWLKKQDKKHEIRSLAKKLDYEKGLINYMRNVEEHFDAKLINRQLHQGKRQQEYHRSLIDEEKRKEWLRVEKIEEERTAEEIRQKELNRLREEKLRQLLRLNSPELRELESKLRTAYVTMVRFDQFADKERTKAEEAAEKVLEGRRIEERHKKFEEEEAKKELDELTHKRNYRSELDEQLERKEQSRFESYLQILQEKALIDNIVKKVIDEEIAEVQKKLEKKKEMWECIKNFKEVKQKSKEEEKKQLELEEENIENYLIIKDLREKQLEELKKYKLEVRERVKGKLNELLEEHYRIRNYENELRERLSIEERAALEKKTDLIDAERKLRTRLELQKAEATELRLKAEKLESEKLEERLFAEQMMIKLAEEDKLELMNDRKRRLKQLEHKRIIQQMIEEEKQKKMKDKIYDMQVYIKEQEMEKLRREIIEKERRRMLEETGTKLLGYLPKNVIKDYEDLERLGVDFKHFYLRKPSYFDDNVEA
ncbi:meiosis-specific nuclear structural protein 1-like [Centruroides sculpturatus]|uniref:meiosis-specific nuclear structural protein 1-like n=1 Tax=Centruroides sculpturatus TaxID=218467 RepID=UPI000C6E7086|nr:meiosis-specific nuclear structural protein 1-like [Centruroides sculpturatus]XP_023236148.1 meiosis-specific nuclear structural protein 1-like [Centruroides sculpturatus]